jgi:phage terminase large subunit-like protein
MPSGHPLPECDKIMRLHAQTDHRNALSTPDAAPWLAEYLHEMTVFPKGKHDDQVDLTAQFSIIQEVFPGQGIFRVLPHAGRETQQR